MKIYMQLIGIFWLIFVVYWVVSSFGVKRDVRPGYGERMRVMRLIIFVVVASTVLIARRNGVHGAHTHTQIPDSVASTPLAIIGVVLTALGIGFACWARVNIGRNWGRPMSHKANPELVTSGPYAFVRHPIYTGLIVALIGSALATYAFVVPLVLIWAGFFVFSALREEKYMLEQFPDAYRAYMKRTKRLVPFVW